VIIASRGVDFQIEPVQILSGLYYQPVGTARLYSTEWRVVNFLSLEGAGNNVDAIRKYIEFMVAFCTKHSNTWQPNSTVCNGLLDTVKKEYNKVQELRGQVSQLTRTERGSHRQKRDIFNLVGHVAHSLFGMLDSDSETFYNQKISQLEEKQLNWLKLTCKQTIVVQSTVRSVNKTLHDVSTHELILTKELYKILHYVNDGNKKVENKYALTAFLLALNDHAMRIQQAIVEVKDVYNTLIQVCLHWKNGIVQPQVLLPVRLMEILKISQDSFPHDLEVPVELSEAYAYLLYNMVNVEVYLVKGNLVYIVEVPLVLYSAFNVFEVIAFPVPRKGEEGAFALIHPEKQFLTIDKTKGFYAKLKQTDIQQCKRKH
jgi:hypothetical protein